MKEELNPCPFCGEKARIIWGPEDHSSVIHEVQCSKCFSRSARKYTREEVVEAWNKRPIPEDYVKLTALEESLKLQSNYAFLLNMYDGGKRLKFNNAKEWIERLEKIEKLEGEG